MALSCAASTARYDKTSRTPQPKSQAAARRRVHSPFDCARKALNFVTRPRARGLYCDEIDVPELRTKHPKFDSQTALPHRARDRATDGLRPQVWPLRASRCD